MLTENEIICHTKIGGTLYSKYDDIVKILEGNKI